MTWSSYPPDTCWVADTNGGRLDFVIGAVPDGFQLSVCDVEREECTVTVHATVAEAKEFAGASGFPGLEWRRLQRRRERVGWAYRQRTMEA